ncbi:cytochrome P460 family protein [Rhizobium sp. RCC_161_2]|uniref:cytochrome P460 family protein n=1 Tax=Rhizobium sp. RCC_161_2 TaxID=3239219 RepID=UPI003523EC58
MKRQAWRWGLVPLTAAAFLTVALVLTDGERAVPAHAESNAVTFPPLDQLVHYTTVRRGQTREHILTSRAALDAIKASQPVPVGTHMVLVDYQSEVLYRYLVSQKTGEGVDDWQFQWFWPDRSIKADENTAQCYACHQRSNRDRQFMFTFNDALNFK